MNLLLHICCAPCTIYPLKILRQTNFSVHGFFYNPNIHPYREYRKRRDAVEIYAKEEGFPVIWTEDYAMEEFLRGVAFREDERCRYCYHQRLEQAARIAKRGKFAAFTTTLLYSRFQNHELIRSIGENLGRRWGVAFHYVDFREGWEEGIELSRRAGMYRQSYCGCIYSEKARYFRDPGMRKPPVEILKGCASEWESTDAKSS